MGAGARTAAIAGFIDGATAGTEKAWMAASWAAMSAYFMVESLLIDCEAGEVGLSQSEAGAWCRTAVSRAPT